MTGKTGNGASERQLIQHVLAVIEQRLSEARQIGSASFHNPDFIHRRFDELVNDLALAHDTIADLTAQLYGSTENPVPAELRHAMRSRGGGLQAVHLHIGGTPRTVMVPPQGCDDPVAEARLWNRLQERYGEDGR